MTRDLRKAIELIKSFEGILDGDPTTVNLDPYLCPAGYWTIGWGHVVLDAKGRQIKGKNRKQDAYDRYPGGITRSKAEDLLNQDLRRFIVGVENLVDVPLNDYQFGALVSFTFNLGLGAFSKSTLRRVINQGEYAKAPEQFVRWVRSGGKVLNGLVRRRKAEVALWQHSC